MQVELDRADLRILEVLQHHGDLSAADIALLLVEAADALQRLPTILEPDGFGDNISCLVIKITESV